METNATPTVISLHALAEAAFVFNNVLPQVNPAALYPEQRNGLKRSLEDVLNHITDYMRRATPPRNSAD